MRNILFSFIMLCIVTVTAYGQEPRTFKFNNNEIVYYLFSNMSPSFMKFPNHKAKFIVVDEQNSLLEASVTNKIRDEKLARKDEILYYYLKLPKLKNQKQYVTFLKEFITDTYNRDFFDKNTTSIHFNNSEVPFGCNSLDELNVHLSKIVVTESNSLLDCNASFVLSADTTNTLKTSVRYESITIKESEQERKNHQVISQLHNWKHNFFITLTLGNHTIDSNYKTDFDEETFVDISDVNSMWTISSGYMFTNKIGGLLNFSLMTSKEQTSNINGISVSGSGNGVGIFKFGIGARYIAFAKKNWSIYGDFQGGWLNVRAEGGTGSGTIFGVTRDITEKTERSNYLSFVLGANYRLGKTMYLTSNFDYTRSNFDTDIGSISGFTGYTINLGVGFSFK